MSGGNGYRGGGAPRAWSSGGIIAFIVVFFALFLLRAVLPDLDSGPVPPETGAHR